jgi:hypothetical protein
VELSGCANGALLACAFLDGLNLELVAGCHYLTIY